jgi:hypothetical protein
MISAEEISHFPNWKQIRIREDIAEWVRNGHSADHLRLGHDGSVMLDREAVTDAAWTNIDDHSRRK